MELNIETLTKGTFDSSEETLLEPKVDKLGVNEMHSLQIITVDFELKYVGN